MVVPPLSPRGYEDFCRLVLPELRRRGVFRREYPRRTLHETVFGAPISPG